MNTCAIRSLRGIQYFTDFSLQDLPATRFATTSNHLTAIRIIQIQYGTLHLRIRGAMTGRVLGIAIDLGRTSHVALRQQARRITILSEGRSKKQRFTGNNLLRRVHVGNNQFLGLLGTTSHSGQGCGSTHQLHEITTLDGVLQFLHLHLH